MTRDGGAVRGGVLVAGLAALVLLVGCSYPKYVVRETDVVCVTVDEGFGRRGSVLPGADPASFVAIDNRWAKDANAVYRYTTPIDGALPDFFVRLDRNYFVDAARVYLRETPLPGADPATFTVVEDDTRTIDARDLERCYRRGAPVDCPPGD